MAQMKIPSGFHSFPTTIQCDICLNVQYMNYNLETGGDGVLGFWESHKEGCPRASENGNYVPVAELPLAARFYASKEQMQD